MRHIHIIDTAFGEGYHGCMRKITIWSFFLVLLVTMGVVLLAGPPAYRLDLTIYASGEEFTLTVEIDDRQFSGLQSDPTTNIQPFLLQAKKEFAEKIGYRKEIYGEENFKMVHIGRYNFNVRSLSQGRIVLQKK